MNEILQFKKNKEENIKKQGKDQELIDLGMKFIKETSKYNYSYNFSWLGRPIIQFPQDMIAMQEIIWETKPDMIIETGIAHGGSLIFYASLLELIGKGNVLGIDIDIRSYNRIEIENHPMSKRIEMLEGSSISESIISKVKERVKGKAAVMVILDSNHIHEHVFKELNLYSPFVTRDSYLVVYDTVVEEMAEKFNYHYHNRPWSKGNNPMTAVKEFLIHNDDFKIDRTIENKLLITVAPGGYLKRVK